MSTLRVEVCRIDEITPVENSIRLDLAKVKGWYTIVGRGEHKVGNLVVFCPIDSVIPDSVIEKYGLSYLKNGNRVRTVKLRGVISQGLVLPNDKNYPEGTDVTQELGITKYETPELKRQANCKQQLKKRQRNTFFDKYTDIENIRNFPNVFTTDDHVILLEKIHGSNVRFAHLKRNIRENWFLGLWDKLINKIFGEYEIIYGSHNVQLRWNQYAGVKEGYYESNIYEKVAKKYNLDKIIPKDYIIYGEVYGDGVQELTYGLKDGEIDLVVYDIKYKEKYLNWDQVTEFCDANNLVTPPILYYGNWYDALIEEDSGGDSILAEQNNEEKQIREGFVVKMFNDCNHPKIGRKILKSINPDYLTRKAETAETH